MTNGEANGLAFLMVFWTIGGILGLGIYVWYLWALSKLFPYLGLPSGWGWIPVWNQWQLIQRGGLPGWLVLLGLVPGLGIVVVVVSVIAINRINAEFGKGAGFTVLGFFLPPLWAMMLANHIADQGYATGFGGGPQRSSAPAGVAGPGSAPVAPTQSAPGFAPQQTFPQQGAPVPAAPGHPQPAFPQQGVPQQVAPQPGYPQQDQGWGPPQQAPAAPMAPAPQAAQPQDQHAQGGWHAQQSVFGAPPAPAAPQQPFAPQPGAQGQADPASRDPRSVAPQPPAVPGPQPAAGGDWGFSRTTEGDYERLAAESIPARVAPPLGVNEPLRPFSWPEAQEETGSALPVVDPLVLPDPPTGRTAGRTAEREAEPAQDAAAESAVEVSGPVASATSTTPNHAAEPVQELRPEALAEPPAAAPAAAAPVETAPEAPVAEPEAAAAPAPAPAVAPAAAAAGAAAAQSSEEPDAGDPAPAAPAEPAPAAAPEEEPEDDRTIVVPRRTRWGLELPDGQIIELVGDDIVVGRKPQAVESAVVLQIPDPTRTMSKSHVRMRRTGEDWTVEDLGSTNGLALVDERGESIPLDAGDERSATERLVIGTLEVTLRPMD